MAKHINRKKKEKETCRQLSESQMENLARLIIGEAECTDVSRGISRRRKRRLTPAGVTMIF
ncbi:hypothetical protein [Bacteroides reticulotermitis]|uniref:Uncharacterized protein n=2 Tax=Bacteroides reticulotermitis TaxID=1133319 RepID=W4UWT7_9BACE|nr:hypothetical protein [Bacteroides reticulotermitis]MBB4045812.1 hypothetical protein [Bacteroides reticulotermitis]GAE84954.1 hypothetical protein JCM10512_3338 [Bacteroides reticulotermitis JCM 10512]